MTLGATVRSSAQRTATLLPQIPFVTEVITTTKRPDASLGIKLLIGLGVSGGAVVVVGTIGAIIIGVAINYLFTKLEVSGNTLEGYLNDFADWLIFWD